jgi:hypothetical protein
MLSNANILLKCFREQNTDGDHTIIIMDGLRAGSPQSIEL